MMKNIKNRIGMGVFMLLSSWAVSSCTDKSDWDIDSSYNRPFGTDENGISIESDTKVARATVSWTASAKADYYLIEVSTSAFSAEDPMGAAEGSIVYGDDAAKRITSSPYVMDNLVANTTYYLRIKSISGDKESLWVNYKKTFASVKAETILNIPDTEDLPEGEGKARMSWEAGLSVDHFEIVATGSTDVVSRNITSEEVAAGEAWIEGLKPFTEYTVTIYNGSTLRGSQTFTAPGLEIASSISNITATSAVFSWEKTVNVDEYACVLSTEGVPASGIKLSPADIAAHQITITGLASSTEYTAYAFSNGSICSRITFTTKKGKPTDYTEMTWEDAVVNWENLTGKVLINVSGAETFTQANEAIPAGVTHLVFWGNSTSGQADMNITKPIGAIGNCEKIEFYNLNIIDNGAKTTLIYQNNASASIKEVAITSCTVNNTRGLVRLNAAASSAMSIIVDDCIIRDMGSQNSGSNHYGILLSNSVTIGNISLSISNSSFINTAIYNSASQLIRTSSSQATAIAFKNCTFYNMSSLDALFRDTQSKASVTVSNTLFAKGGVKPFYNAASATSTLSVNGLYRASDFVFDKVDWSQGYTTLALTSDQLFPNGSSGDLTYGTEVSAEYKAIGDQRWNK